MKRLFLLLCIALTSVSVSLADSQLPQIAIVTNNKASISKEYVKGNITITDTDGSVVSLNAKFKMRGATAAEYPQKPSMNVKLRDESGAAMDSTLLGLRSCSKWILDAMAIDRICMRNRVAMDIWNDYSSVPYQTSFPVTNSQGNTIYRNGTIGKYVEVTINGKYKGVYVLSDHINRKLLDLKKIAVKQTTANDTVRGVLYKSGTLDILDQNSPVFTDDYTACVASWHDAWELKEPEDYECREAWYPLLDAMGSSLGSGKGVKVSNYAAVKKYFYIDNLVDYQLHVMALAIQDNWGNKNHYFSIRNIQKDINDADPIEAAKRKFVITPWDLDTSLGGHYKGAFHDGDYGEEWLPEYAVKAGGCFPFSLCQSSAEYRGLLKNRWQALRRTTYHPSSVNRRMETYRDLLVGSGAWARQANVQPRYVDDLVKEVAYIEQWYYHRFQLMDAYFGITDGVETVSLGADELSVTAVYSVDGRRRASLHRGINIVRYSDGSSRSVVVR